MKLALAPLLLAVSLSAQAQEGPADPEGTVVVVLEVGEATDAPARAGAMVICDDPSIVAPELVGDGGTSFLLRGLAVGTTLCGVRQEGQIPGGLYRIRVTPKKKKPAAVEAPTPPPPKKVIPSDG